MLDAKNLRFKLSDHADRSKNFVALIKNNFNVQLPSVTLEQVPVKIAAIALRMRNGVRKCRAGLARFLICNDVKFDDSGKIIMNLICSCHRFLFSIY